MKVRDLNISSNPLAEATATSGPLAPANRAKRLLRDLDEIRAEISKDLDLYVNYAKTEETETISSPIIMELTTTVNQLTRTYYAKKKTSKYLIDAAKKAMKKKR